MQRHIRAHTYAFLFVQAVGKEILSTVTLIKDAKAEISDFRQMSSEQTDAMSGGGGDDDFSDDDMFDDDEDDKLVTKEEVHKRLYLFLARTHAHTYPTYTSVQCPPPSARTC